MERMTKALPVWGRDMENDLNRRLQFRLTDVKATDPFLQIATSGIYQLYVNDKFVCYGPARAGAGHFRVDRIDLTPYWKGRKTVVTIDVVGYNTENFYILCQPSFLQAELDNFDGTPVAWTGDGRWEAIVAPGYMQKVQRYDLQRTFIEAYRMDADYNAFRAGLPENEPRIELVTLPGGELIERRVPYPMYESLPARVIDGGSIEVSAPAAYIRHEAQNNPTLTQFSVEELDFDAFKTAQEIHLLPEDGKHGLTITAPSYRMYRFPHNATGFLSFHIVCKTPCVISVLFDELMNDRQICFCRLIVNNHIRWELQPGTYDIVGFEPYTMQYLALAVLQGECTVSQVKLIEYKHPPVAVDLSAIADNKSLLTITEAAIETFRQNAVDLFTDCPSRERAGWNCDAFFIARVAYLLTGNVEMETAFFENFLHAETYPRLPAGMLPMCYPADFTDGLFIPNWALWFVLQLEEYSRRGGDVDLIARMRGKVYDLLRYLAGFENEDGLLENLPSWVFVDWSDARFFTEGVSYPSNMLYSAALRAAGTLYGDGLLIERAERVAAAVEEQSFDGKFFLDHAIRKDGRLFRQTDCSEACQTYAIFFGIAPKERYPRLYRIVTREMGQRRRPGSYPSVKPGEAFISCYLRLEIMFREGEAKQALQDIRKMTANEAQLTGTLWEKFDPNASCCHGFASHILYWLLDGEKKMPERAVLRSAYDLSEDERKVLQMLRDLSADRRAEFLKLCDDSTAMDQLLAALSEDSQS